MTKPIDMVALAHQVCGIPPADDTPAMREVIGELRRIHNSMARGNRHWAQAQLETLLRRLDIEPNEGSERA